MAKLHTISLLFVFFMVSSFSSASRLLKDCDLPQNLPADEPVIEIELTGDVVGDSLVKRSEEDSTTWFPPCDMTATDRRAAATGFQALRRCRKNGQFLLAMLPKGPVPPSGPGKRTNDIKN